MLPRAKALLKLGITEGFVCRCKESTDVKSYSRLFFNLKVQLLLKKLTHIDLKKVFEPRPTGEPSYKKNYKLMTTEELELENQRAKEKAQVLLQMPPVLEVNKNETEILDDDPGLDGFDEHHSKYVFTDISSDVQNEDRIIVVREPNGILRTANFDERSRMNQVYFPVKGKYLDIPNAFKDENLKNILDREDYKFILDWACLQFEPDDPHYIRVTSTTYNVINERSHFTKLHSTRHFGSLTFYLLINKNIDNMLLDNIKSERIDDACTLIKLYHLIHPECQSAQQKKQMKEDLEMVEDYIQLDSNCKNLLELAWSTYLSKDKVNATSGNA